MNMHAVDNQKQRLGAEPIILPKPILKRVDVECERRMISRSRFVLEVLEWWFQDQCERRRLMSGAREYGEARHGLHRAKKASIVATMIEDIIKKKRNSNAPTYKTGYAAQPTQGGSTIHGQPLRKQVIRQKGRGGSR